MLIRLPALLAAAAIGFAAAAPAQTVLDRVKPSLVYVVITDPDAPKNREYGTGFFISAEGWILTANHLLAGKENAVVTVRRSSITAPDLPARHTGNFSDGDIILLQVQGDATPYQPLALTSSSCIGVGAELWSAGFEGGQNLLLLPRRILSSKDPMPRQPGDAIPMGSWIVKPGFAHGDSGAPVMPSGTAGVAAIVSAGDEDMQSGIIVPIDRARPLLDRIPIQLERCAAGEPHDDARPKPDLAQHAPPPVPPSGSDGTGKPSAADDLKSPEVAPWVAEQHLRNHPHVVASSTPGIWVPDAGYDWTRPDDRNSKDVRWVPGRHLWNRPHVVSASVEGVWLPDSGYDWTDPSDRSSPDVSWVPGRHHAHHSHIVAMTSEGDWKPDPGYDWAHSDGSLEVRWVPGMEHPSHAHVFAAADEGAWLPAPGYVWADPHDDRSLDVRPGNGPLR